MALLRVDARPLLPRLRGELTALLASLPDGDWAHPTPCPGWSVHDLAAHLLGVELGNASVRRDRWEIALLRAVPRTASVTAHTDTTVYKLARQPFLIAVLGHAATERQAHSIAETTLAADAARGHDDQVAGTVEPS